LASLAEPERTTRGLKLLDERWDEHWLAQRPMELALAQAATVDRDQLDPEGVQGRRLQMQARGGHDVWDRLGAITSPTLVGYGRHDGIAPAVNSRAIVSRIPGAELRGYEGGHLFIVQDPDAIPDFTRFLAEP
jgi:3-oxoadipate enol-lactonase